MKDIIEEYKKAIISYRKAFDVWHSADDKTHIFEAEDKVKEVQARMYKGVVELNAIGNKGIATLFDEVFDLICCTDTEIDIVSQIMEGEVEDLLKARDNTCQKRINVEKSLIFFDNNKKSNNATLESD